MNKIIIFISFIVAIVLGSVGRSTNLDVNNQKEEYAQLESNNFEMSQKIKDKEFLTKRKPVPLAREYSLVMNHVRILESYSGTRMNVELEGIKDVDDISSRYVDTEYKGVMGLKIRIVVDKFSKETDMGAMLDDIHLLEKNTDFMATEITKDNNNLIIKGEVYGL